MDLFPSGGNLPTWCAFQGRPTPFPGHSCLSPKPDHIAAHRWWGWWKQSPTQLKQWLWQRKEVRPLGKSEDIWLCFGGSRVVLKRWWWADWKQSPMLQNLRSSFSLRAASWVGMEKERWCVVFTPLSTGRYHHLTHLLSFQHLPPQSSSLLKIKRTFVVPVSSTSIRGSSDLGILLPYLLLQEKVRNTSQRLSTS